uniref:Uncharacterized protein n=1 Tax=Glossina pallidipes TaxID=7398 RepID=A0A1A9Z5X2_GLOPL
MKGVYFGEAVKEERLVADSHIQSSDKLRAKKKAVGFAVINGVELLKRELFTEDNTIGTIPTPLWITVGHAMKSFRQLTANFEWGCSGHNPSKNSTAKIPYNAKAVHNLITIPTTHVELDSSHSSQALYRLPFNQISYMRVREAWKSHFYIEKSRSVKCSLKKERDLLEKFGKHLKEIKYAKQDFISSKSIYEFRRY